MINVIVALCSCRAFFWYLWRIPSCRVFLSSLDGVNSLYRTLFHSTKWLCCCRYCFKVCGCEYSLHPFSLFLLMKYFISLIAASWLYTLIQSFINLAFRAFSKVSVTCILQEYASIKVVPCVTFEMSAWTMSVSMCWSWFPHGSCLYICLSWLIPMGKL